MPVHRFANYPGTRVYTNAFIVIHAGLPWCVPMVDGLMQAGEPEILEFGKAAFQTTDWTRDDIEFRMSTPDALLIFVEIPGSLTITLQLCKDKLIHIQPRFFQ